MVDQLLQANNSSICMVFCRERDLTLVLPFLHKKCIHLNHRVFWGQAGLGGVGETTVPLSDLVHNFLWIVHS